MAEEEETIGDVLSRTGALKKDEMIAEVEAYGMEVHASWTKDDIMDHFEAFLVEGDVGEDVEEIPAADDGVPDPPDAPKEYSEAALSPEAQAEVPPPAPPAGQEIQIQIPRSRAWGQTQGAKAP